MGILRRRDSFVGKYRPDTETDYAIDFITERREHSDSAIVADLFARLARWGEKTDDAMTAELVTRWSSALGQT